MPQWTREFIGLAHVDDLQFTQVLLDPMGIDLPDAGKGEGQRSPGWAVGGLGTFPPPAFQIGRHGDIHQLWMRQSEVPHVAGEIVFAQFAAEAGVESPFLADARDREPAIVMPRVEKAGLRQGEDMGMHRAIEGPWIALLEIGPPASANEQAVAGEGHAFVVQHISDAAVRVPRRRPDLQISLAESDPLAIPEIAVCPLGTGRVGKRDLAVKTLLEGRGTGHMIGMDMGLEGELQLEAELAQ